MRVVPRRPLIIAAFGVAAAVSAFDSVAEEPHRAISLRVAQLLALARPTYDSGAKSTQEQVPPLLQRAGVFEADPNVVRLSPFIVTDRYVPPASVVDPNAATRQLERKYLGSAYGLDRAILNRFTIADYWRKIPILGQHVSLAGSTAMTNGQRAGAYAADDARAQRIRDMMDSTSATKGTPAEKLDKELRKQFQDALADPRYK